MWIHYYFAHALLWYAVRKLQFAVYVKQWHKDQMTSLRFYQQQLAASFQCYVKYFGAIWFQELRSQAFSAGFTFSM